MPSDDTAVLSVIPIALFGSEAVNGTGSMHVSIAGRDTHRPVDRVTVMPHGLLCSVASQAPSR